jgi:urease accessory protein
MISRLHIAAGFKNNKTYLKNSFCTSPFKIGNITEDRRKSLIKLMLMSSSPGILDNDSYEIKIDIEENAELQISTQGYQRIFTMQNGAKQTINISLAENASLCYLPHPSVPHKSSLFKSVNTIYLKTNHNLIWNEIVTCGRKLSNEAFAFTSFHNTTNIYLNGKLVVKENLLIEPAKTNISAIGQLEGYSHQSSLLFINNKADCRYLMQDCIELLAPIEGIEYGISELPVNGFTIRMLGNKGEQLFEIQNRLTLLLAAEAVTESVDERNATEIVR